MGQFKMTKKCSIFYKGVGGNISLKKILREKKHDFNCFTKNIETAKSYAYSFAEDTEKIPILYVVSICIDDIQQVSGPDEYVFIGKPNKIKILKKIKLK